MRKTERKPAKEGMRCHSQKSAFPRRGRSRLSARTLKPGWQAEEGGEGCWHPEQRDRDLASYRGTGITPQPFFPREALLGALRPGKDDLRAVWLERRGLRKGDLDPLGAQQAHAGSAMLPPTPIRATSRGAVPTWRGCSRTLTRRGFVVCLPCHWHCSLKGHPRH